MIVNQPLMYVLAESTMGVILLVHGSAEQIRRNMRIENLVMNYVTQARLFTGVKMPMEAVARAHEGLVLCEKMGPFCSVKGSLKECFICEKLGFCLLKRMLEEIIKNKKHDWIKAIN